MTAKPGTSNPILNNWTFLDDLRLLLPRKASTRPLASLFGLLAVGLGIGLIGFMATGESLQWLSVLGILPLFFVLGKDIKHWFSAIGQYSSNRRILRNGRLTKAKLVRAELVQGKGSQFEFLVEYREEGSDIVFRKLLPDSTKMVFPEE